MTVDFHTDDLVTPYGYGQESIPRVGELVEFDGSDPDRPKGLYRVGSVRHVIGLRGLRYVRVELVTWREAEAARRDAERHPLT